MRLSAQAMSKTTKYITVRDGIYQYHRRVPQDIQLNAVAFDMHFGGKPLFRRSLGTADLTEALGAAHNMARLFDALVAKARGTALPSANTKRRPVTPEFLAKVSQAKRDSVARPFRMALTHREGGVVDHAVEVERMREQFEQDAEAVTATLVNGEPSSLPYLDVEANCRDLIEFENLHAPVGSDARGLLQRSIRDGLLAGYRDVGDLLEGKAPVIPAKEARRAPRAPAFSRVIEIYLERQSRQRTRNEIKGAARAFIDLLGDLPLDEITHEHFLRFCKHQASQTIGGSVGSVSRPMSASTLQKKIALLRAAINHARDTGVFTGANPAERLKADIFCSAAPKAIMPDKRPFEVDELNDVFEYPWFTGSASASRRHKPGEHLQTGMYFWGPVVALLTGCRASELGGLATDEVRLEHQHPHIIIRDNRFRRTKGSYRRKVPILDQLMELGFAEFVATARDAGHERLFHDWAPPAVRKDAENDEDAWSNGSMVRSFNTVVIPKVLRRKLAAEARREVTFHSFRGAFKTMLGLKRWGLPPNYIHEVVGHEKFGLDKRYVREIPLEETYPAIRGCRFDGLRIPSRSLT